MRFYAGVGAVIGWSALVLQLVLMLTAESELTVGARSVNFFSYFTILSNIFAALMLTSASRGGGFFVGRPTVQTAITVYMTVTGLIYTVILAPLWSPTGWQFVADAILHYVMPVAVILFWLVFVRKGTLGAFSVAWILVFPLLYAGYTLIRGPSAGDWYPYPFINAAELSTGQLVVNIIAITAGFVVVALIYVGLDRLMSGRPLRRAA